MRYLRLAEKPRTVWVDALSINQIDDEEKTHQVQHMRKIYELASRVVIWLGKASDDSDLAMDLIADIHRVGPQDYKANLEDAKSWENAISPTLVESSLGVAGDSSLSSRPYRGSRAQIVIMGGTRIGSTIC